MAWLREVRHGEGHRHLCHAADDLLLQVRAQDIQEGPARELFARITDVLAAEIETSISCASHPGATMQSSQFFRALELSGRSYRVSAGWARYLDRIFDLLHEFFDALLAERGWVALPFDSGTAGKLASALYPIRGSALRGPQFDVKIAADLPRLCSLLERAGFFVPLRDIAMFSEVEGPADESIFTIDDDACFRGLLVGAAKSRDPHAKRIVTYFLKDEERWVAALASELLTMHFHVA